MEPIDLTAARNLARSLKLDPTERGNLGRAYLELEKHVQPTIDKIQADIDKKNSPQA